MKKIMILLAGFAGTMSLNAQNVGIGTTNPSELLTVNGTALIDASNLNNGFFPNGKVLKFGTLGGVGIGSNKIGGPSTNGLEFFTGFSRRFVIDSTGNVGINADAISSFRLTVNGNSYIGGLALGTTSPDLFSYKLDVEGNTRVRNDSYVNRDLWVDRNFDVDGTSNFFGNITASSNLSIGGNITAVDNITVSGNITVDGGRGVIRSTNSTQQVVSYPVGSVQFGNAPAGYTTDVTFAFSNVFSAIPKISIAQITGTSGNFERWFYTIHSIDLATRTFLVRFYTPNGTGGSTTMTLNFIAIGAAL